MSSEMYTLQDYLARLARETPGELVTIERPVAAHRWEATGILELLQNRKEYPAVLFASPENPNGRVTDVRLVMNVFATQAKVAMALGLGPNDWSRASTEFARRLSVTLPPVVIPPDEAPAREIVLTGSAVDVNDLPTVRKFELDAGPYLGMALIVRDPDEGFYNVSFIRALCNDPRRLPTYVSATRHSWQIFKKYEERGQPCRVAYVTGHHPAFFMGSLNLSPFGADEYAVIGSVMGAPLRLTRSETWGNDFLVPADAEIVLEGEMRPGERALEGPMAEWCGYVGVQQFENAPVIDLTAITRRRQAIHQHIFVSRMDNRLLGLLAKEAEVYNVVKGRVPGVKAVAFMPSGLYRFFCVISLKKRAEGEQQHAALAALAACEWIKWVFLVDDDIDPTNEEQVWWAVATRCQPHDDLIVIPKMKHEQIDPSLHEHLFAGSKIIVDATRELDRDWPPINRLPADVMARLRLEDYLPRPVGSGQWAVGSEATPLAGLRPGEKTE